MRSVNSEEFIDEVVKGSLRFNPSAKIAVIGPSTLERDHSLLYFSDILSGTESTLLAVDLPGDMKRIGRGSLPTITKQMEHLRKKHSHLKKPEYIGQNVYKLDERIEKEGIDIIYDHCSLPFIAHNRSPGLISYDKAVSEIIKMYAKLIKKGGKIIIMDYYNFSPSNNEERERTLELCLKRIHEKRFYFQNLLHKQ